MNRKSIKPMIVSGAVIGLLIFLQLVGWLQPIENIIIFITKPILGVVYEGGSRLKVLYDQQTDRRDWQKEALELRDRTVVLTAENASLKILEEENKELRSHLKFLTNRQKKYVLANIIAGNESSLVNQSVMIDRGSKDGLFTGLAVLSSTGQVVGKVTKVDKESSELCLITQNGCQFAAAIQNQNKTIGIVKGDLGLTMKMEFIPQSEKIKNGDIVITSGLEKNITRGQILGQVSEVVKENNALWQTAKIDSLTNINELVFVSIVLP